MLFFSFQFFSSASYSFGLSNSEFQIRQSTKSVWRAARETFFGEKKQRIIEFGDFRKEIPDEKE